MTYVITDDCTCCGACAEQCPVQAISEQDGQYVIDENCEECGNCYDICFLEAIKIVESVKRISAEKQ